MESLTAVLAGIRPGVRVDQQVGGQGGRSLKALAALLALEISSGGVLLAESRRKVPCTFLEIDFRNFVRLGNDFGSTTIPTGSREIGGGRRTRRG